MRSHPRTIPQVLDRIADQFSEHDALVTAGGAGDPAGGDRRLTFAELRDEVRHAAAALIDLGVNTGDRIAIWSPNTWHWVVACLATTYAGGVLVPLNTRYTASEATDILARTGAPLLFASGEFLGADKAASIDRDVLPDLRHVVRVPIEKSDGTWDEFMSRGADLGAADARAAAVKPDDVSDILFTSGTTGRSKGRFARIVNRWPGRRRGRSAARSPATTATSASIRSSTTSATRPESWRACRPGRR